MQRLEVLMLFVMGLLGVPGPIEFPKMHWVTPVEMSQVAGCKTPCPTLEGYYREDDMYVVDKLQKLESYAEGVIVHELVHHVQYQRGDRKQDCESNYRREQSAYRVQMIFLDRHDISVSATTLAKC